MDRSQSTSVAGSATEIESHAAILGIPRQIAGILAVVAVLGIATSLLYFRHFKDFYNPDSPTYITPVAHMLSGQGFTDAEGAPDTYRTPGYPLFIAPFVRFHIDLKFLILVQHLLRVVLICATCYAAFKLTRSRRQALLAGIVLCIDLPFLRSANSILTETLFTGVFAIVLFLLWHESKDETNAVLRWVVAGLLGGAAVLIRPVGLFFFVPAAAYILLVRRNYRLRAAAVFVLAFAVIPVFWAARNYRQTGYFIVSSISGSSVLEYRAAGALAINEPGDFYANQEKHFHELAQDVCRTWESQHGRDCRQMSVPERATYYTRFGSKVVRQHPLAYLKLTLRGVGMTMFTGSPASLSDITGMPFNTAARVLLIYTVPAFGFALYGLWRSWRKDRPFFWLAFLVCGYFILISAGAESFARFRVPIMPLYVILVAIGIDSVLARLPSRRPAPDKSESSFII